MAHEFCETCKLGTRAKCRSCPKYREPPKIEVVSSMAYSHFTRSYISLCGRSYFEVDPWKEEEHY